MALGGAGRRAIRHQPIRGPVHHRRLRLGVDRHQWTGGGDQARSLASRRLPEWYARFLEQLHDRRRYPTPGNAGAAHLDFSVTDQVLAPWSYSALSYRIKSFKAGLGVDLYLAMLLDGEGNQCVSPESVFTYSLPPFVTGLALANTQAGIFAGKLPARVNDVALTLYGVLVATGTSPADSANWVSNVAALDLAMGTLSSPQNEVIADRGNPPAFIIDFDRARGRRVETRILPAGQFPVHQRRRGRHADNGERASGNARPAARYSPGRFSPATTRQEIRRCSVIPTTSSADRCPGVVHGSSTARVSTVTLEGGVIRRVEVY